MKKEPYRNFFLTGIFYLLWGTLIWVPQIFTDSTYPVLAHRYLMLNGFSASFIAGFLMTAVPKFSGTEPTKTIESRPFAIITAIGVMFAYLDLDRWTAGVSALQATLILTFLFRRIQKRSTNPPYSFVFLFVGMGLWLFSALSHVVTGSEAYKYMHYEGAIAALILGVGSRLVPGILGHIEIVQTQRKRYETNLTFLKTVPLLFWVLMISFVVSFFLQGQVALLIRTLVVCVIAFKYWSLHKLPREKTALTANIWISCWLIILSFILKLFWFDGDIHASHAFFFSGTLLLTLLISMRVLQSHGPGDKSLENRKAIYFISAFIILSGATRVSAVLLPENYLHHLGYSALMLTLAVLLFLKTFQHTFRVANR